MLWAIKFDLPSCAQLTYNCYHYWSTLVVRDKDGLVHFLHRKEGLNQRVSLAIISYGISILLLIYELRTAHPHVTQPWYADGAGAGGMFEALNDHMRYLMVREPPRGYFPEPTKSILLVSPKNVHQVEAHFQGMGGR